MSDQAVVTVDVPGIVDGEATLPPPQQIDWEHAKDVFRRGEQLEHAGWFLQGFAASCVEVTYGESSLRQFVKELRSTTYETTVQRRRVYKRLIELEESDRSQFLEGVRVGMLSYTHLLTANSLRDDQEYVKVLRTAHDKEWSKRKLAEEVAVRRASESAYSADQPDVPPQTPDESPRRVTCPTCKGEGEVEQ